MSNEVALQPDPTVQPDAVLFDNGAIIDEANALGTLIRRDDVIRMVGMMNINIIRIRLQQETENASISAYRLRRYAIQIAIMVQEDIERYGETLAQSLNCTFDGINSYRRDIRSQFSYGADVDLMGVAISALQNEIEWATTPSIPSVEDIHDILYEEPSVPKSSTLTYQAYKQSVVKKRITAVVRDDINDKCPICLESFKLGRTVHKTSCGHHFHPRCLQHFICKVGPNKCPVCRTCIEPTSVSHTQ